MFLYLLDGFGLLGMFFLCVCLRSSYVCITAILLLYIVTIDKKLLSSSILQSSSSPKATEWALGNSVSTVKSMMYSSAKHAYSILCWL